MMRCHFVRAALACSTVLVAVAPAQAAARVFVSVNGNDTNPCENIGTPCRTFAGGINRVDTNGEVIVLDTGSYGGTTITKAVRLNAPAGVVAFAASPFVINAPGATVVLRGLTLKALTMGTGIAITYTAAAALHVESCVLDGWDTGLSLRGAGAFFVKDSIFRNMANAGLDVPLAVSVSGSIDNSRFENNTLGVVVAAGKVTIRNSVASGSVTEGIAVDSLGVGSEVNVDKCTLANNGGSGLSTTGAGTVGRISNSIVTDNGTGLQNFGGGATLKSWQNNAIDGNAANTAGAITMISLQ
jgi:hypothetical protein